MTDIQAAIDHLKTKGIESFELMNILVIPVDSCEQLDQTAKDIKRYLQECDYQKSWRLDPYYYERHNSVTAEMFDN